MTGKTLIEQRSWLWWKNRVEKYSVSSLRVENIPEGCCRYYGGSRRKEYLFCKVKRLLASEDIYLNEPPKEICLRNNTDACEIHKTIQSLIKPPEEPKPKVVTHMVGYPLILRGRLKDDKNTVSRVANQEKKRRERFLDRKKEVDRVRDAFR